MKFNKIFIHTILTKQSTCGKIVLIKTNIHSARIYQGIFPHVDYAVKIAFGDSRLMKNMLLYWDEFIIIPAR